LRYPARRYIASVPKNADSALTRGAWSERGYPSTAGAPCVRATVAWTLTGVDDLATPEPSSAASTADRESASDIEG